MQLILDNDEKLIGRSHIILRQKNYIKKYYPIDHVTVATGGDSTLLKNIKRANWLMKIVHPDLYVKEEVDNNFYCVTQNFIEHKPCNKFGYTHNIKSYLQLVDKLGYDYSKRDLQYYNLLYRKSDDKPFCIDWDSMKILYSEEDAYNYYMDELVSLKWLSFYNISREDALNVFNKEWNNV